MQADFILDYDVLTVQQPQKLYLMARLVSGPVPQDKRRRPLNIGLVIDHSGSMAGPKLDYTRQAAQFLVQNLGAHDTLSIVLYNDKVETLLPPEKVQRKDAINQRIDGIKASGTTNLSGGWLEGCRLVAQNHHEDEVNRVILMSDGLANRGITDSEKLLTLARQKFAEGVSTTTMGLGRDFNEDLMMALASAGGGAFYFIESPEVAPTIFHEELHGLLTVVGQNLSITVQPTAHVTAVGQLNAYPTHVDGSQTTFRLGDVFGDEIKTLLIELTVPGILSIGQSQIATLRFEYDELHEGGTTHRVWELPVMVNVAAQDAEQPQLANPEVRRTVMLLRAAQARAGAVQAADKGDYAAAAKLLRTAAEQLAPYAKEDEKIAEEHEALNKQAAEMERGAAAYDDYSRKSMSTQAFYTMTNRHDATQVLRRREKQREGAPPTVEAPAVRVDAAPPPERQPGVPPAHVVWNDKTIELTGGLIRIGRAPHNEIIIPVAGVSRFHCQIRREGEQWLAEDVGSTNGTAINGNALGKTPHALSVGDVMTICGESLVFGA